MENKPLLKVNNLKKSFEQTEVLKNLDFHVNKGEVVSIIGPSGSGKSTLLRSLNFLETVQDGELIFNGHSYEMSAVDNRTKQFLRQHFTMVFQQYHLFQNKSVLENVMEGLIITKKLTKDLAKEIALKYLEEVNMIEKRDAYPNQLSGGQQQRVGIARALAMEPDIILLDEPTSALDPELVGEVLKVIRNLASKDITMIIVTHEMNFAKDISDRIVFLDEGKILANESPQTFFDQQENKRIKNFLSIVN